MPSHYLKQYWHIVKGSLGTCSYELWIKIRKWIINVVGKISPVSSRPQCVKWTATKMLFSLMAKFVNTMRPRQNGRQLAVILKCAVVNENRIFIRISLKFVPKGGSNRQYVNTGTNNDLAPKRRIAIIYNNDGIVYWRRFVPRGLDHFKQDICLGCWCLLLIWSCDMDICLWYLCSLQYNHWSMS